MNPYFVFLILAAIGATIIVSQGAIFSSVRSLFKKRSSKVTYYEYITLTPSNESIIGVGFNGNEYTTSGDKDVKLFIGTALKGYLLEPIVMDRRDMTMTILIKTKEDIKLVILSSIGKRPMSITPRSKPVQPFAFISDMIHCSMCAGVYVGAIFYGLYYLLGEYNIFFNMLCAGCVVSLGAYLYHLITEVLNK